MSVVRGELYARPFATSSKPFVREAVPAFGRLDCILNPPNQLRQSTYNAQFNRTTLTAQTAGTVAKRSVPYKVNAPRNRVLNVPRVPPHEPIDFTAGGNMKNSTVYPYRVVSRTVQASSGVRMEDRLGFTNTAITADMAKREHLKLWR